MITALGPSPASRRSNPARSGRAPRRRAARTRALILLAIVALAEPAAGWARAASRSTAADPWEPFNRRVFAFNQKVDSLFIRPLSRVTSGLTPGPIGKMIHNFLVNLNEPVVIVNDLLQARPGPAVRSAVRLVVNTTVGGLGAIDVAKALGDPAHVNGFGDTLGRWGAAPGPYLVLPVMGPFDVRDLLGSLVDDATLPLQSVNYPYRTEVTITVAVIGGLNQRQTVERDLQALLADAADPYATLRSTYLQSREAQIRGASAIPALPDIEDSPAPAAPAKAGEETAKPPPSEPSDGTPAGPPPPPVSTPPASSSAPSGPAPERPPSVSPPGG